MRFCEERTKTMKTFGELRKKVRLSCTKRKHKKAATHARLSSDKQLY